jgi:hypothetical protein
MKKKFWKERWLSMDSFVNLLMQYKDSKKEYMENLSEEEREILD